jgi:hypothetical protein
MLETLEILREAAPPVHVIPVAGPGELALHLARIRQHVDAYVVPVDPTDLIDTDCCQ